MATRFLKISSNGNKILKSRQKALGNNYYSALLQFFIFSRDRDRDRDRDRHDHHRRDRDRDRDHHRRDRDRDRDRKSRFEDQNRSSGRGGGSKYFDKEDRENNEHQGFSGEDKDL